jgi:hypothetical protein
MYSLPAALQTTRGFAGSRGYRHSCRIPLCQYAESLRVTQTQTWVAGKETMPDGVVIALVSSCGVIAVGFIQWMSNRSTVKAAAKRESALKEQQVEQLRLGDC